MNSKWFALLIMALLISAVLAAPFILNDTYLASHYVPSPLNILLFVAAVALIIVIRDPIMQLICSGWACWFLIGNIHIIGSYFRHRLLAPLYVQDANTLFLSGILAFIAGVLAHQALFQKANVASAPVRERSSPGRLILLALLGFPVLYAASLVVWRVPTVLLGENIVNEMYEVDKGPIYALRPLLALTMVVVVILVQQQATLRRRLVLTAYFVGLIILSVIDGKRDVALIGLIACSIHLTISNQGKIAVWQIAGAAAALAGYMAIADLRAARIGSVDNALLYLMTAIGVEYKDFVHSYNYFSIEYMHSAGYDWVRSSVANLFNRSILEAFGVDKDAWTRMDSARTWMRVYGVNLGIRTGILSELYFAFGWGMFIGMGALGTLLSWLTVQVRGTRSGISYLIILGLVANLAIAIVSQSTAVAGISVIFLYAYLALVVVRLLTSSAAPSMGSPRSTEEGRHT